MRDRVTASELHTVLKRASVHVSIGHLKAFLRDLGFEHRGAACSVLEILRKCQQVVLGLSVEQGACFCRRDNF